MKGWVCAGLLSVCACGRSSLDVETLLSPTPAPFDDASDEGAAPVSPAEDAPSDSPATQPTPDAAGGPRDASVDRADSAARPDAADAAAPCPAEGCVLSFVSGPEWTAYSGTVSASPLSFTRGPALDSAREVCLNAGDPANCPAGALLYGYATTPQVWSGGQAFPNAHWIWRPDVAPTAPAALQVAIFEKTFVLGTGATGTLQIAADGFAAVFVNGTGIGSTGSVSDVSLAGGAHTVATTFDLTPALRRGSNTVTVAAENGPFGCSSSACPYSENPGGVVFEGTLRW